jgi:putative ubiquitin-RnfH superfamily antitoxin RatB of RatAB toxin-antitoxin module
MSLRITLVYSPSPRQVHEIALELPEGASVNSALQAVSLQEDFQRLDMSQLQIGIWGRKALDSQLLCDLDRIEIYRPLKVNPKVARRERFAKQGARKTGLFAKRKA